MNHLRISRTSQFPNGPSLSKLFQACNDVTTGHMSLRFEKVWRETVKKKIGKFGQGKKHNCAESSGITSCMWIQVCIGHSGVYRGHYRDVKGRLCVSFKSYLVFLQYMIG